MQGITSGGLADIMGVPAQQSCGPLYAGLAANLIAMCTMQASGGRRQTAYMRWQRLLTC